MTLGHGMACVRVWAVCSTTGMTPPRTIVVGLLAMTDAFGRRFSEIQVLLIPWTGLLHCAPEAGAGVADVFLVALTGVEWEKESQGEWECRSHLLLPWLVTPARSASPVSQPLIVLSCLELTPRRRRAMTSGQPVVIINRSTLRVEEK